MKVYHFRPTKEIMWLISTFMLIFLYLSFSLWKEGLLYKYLIKLLYVATILMIITLPILIYYLMHWKFAEIRINEDGLEVIDWKRKRHRILWQEIKSVGGSGYGAVSGIWLYLDKGRKISFPFFLNLTGLETHEIKEIIYFIKQKIKSKN